MSAIYLFSVAQVSNLLSRRFPIGRTPNRSRVCHNSERSQAGSPAIQQVGNLRYSASGPLNAYMAMRRRCLILCILVLAALQLVLPRAAYAQSPPSIITQPQSQALLAGTNASFSVTATGDAPLSYQWYFNNSPLSDSAHVLGSLSAALAISNLTTADSGNYYAVVANSLGAATSSVAILTVLQAPAFITQPESHSAGRGLPTSLYAFAAGYPPPTYQWQLNVPDIPCAADTTYNIVD